MTVPCGRPGCAGTVVDGYCDRCGLAPVAGVPAHAAVGAPVATPAPAPVAVPDLGTPDPRRSAGGCGRAGCAGTVVDGYCDRCGLAPAAAPASAPVQHAPDAAPVGGRASGSLGTAAVRPATAEGATSATRNPGSSGSGRGALGAGLVDVPAVPFRHPLSVVLADPEVAERKRVCGRCGEPVGRSRDGMPGRTEGFCSHCGTAFSYTPKLGPDDLVGGQYQVAGCIAHGGLGWVYLAQDRNVSDRWVVLKGLLDSNDESAMAAAIAERRFLAEVEHPNIVRIYNFVQHDGAGYIVMEYVGGESLRETRNRHRQEQGEPLPVAQAIAHVLNILPALGYLHRRGLLYCDFKPDNVIQTDEQLKLIDLGGVRALDDEESDLYGTIGYQAPEVPDQGASIASDLYTVARTLAVLCLDIPGFQDEQRFATSLPPARAVLAFQRYESFHQFLLRATAPDPAARFGSAEEMADQLLGVLRQVVAIDGGSPPPAASTQFSGELGHGPAADGWRLLPVPTVDPFDPAAALLATAAGVGTDQLRAILEPAPPTPERSFSLARSWIEDGEFEAAERELDSPEAGAGGWRAAWWRGVVLLAAGRPADARAFFGVVAGELPGELAPRLALAETFEREAFPGGEADGEGAVGEGAVGPLGEASRLYGLVVATDPTYAGACFGLSRVRSALGDRTGAVAALGRVPASSSAHLDAQLALVRLYSADVAGVPPTPADLAAASGVLAKLTIEPSVRVPLVRQLVGQALRLLDEGLAAPDPDVLLATVPFEEEQLRTALERSLRALATMAPSAEERYRLVDEANTSRPRTLT